MKISKKTGIQCICLAIALLLGGCQKQTQETEPTILDLSSSSEEQSEISSIQESTSRTLHETSNETSLEGDIAADQPASKNETSSETSLEGNIAADQPVSKNETSNETSLEGNIAVDQPASKVEEADISLHSLIDITKDFYPGDGWTSAFSFQLPEEWSYTIDEDITDWGFLIQVENREDSSIRIYGQQGTINVEQFYADSPTDFVTTSGLQGKFYQEKRTEGDGTSYIEGDIVFDFHFYCIDFYMPEDIFNKNYETLQKIFQSVTIRDIIDE